MAILQWQKSQEGIWERDLDECEKFYRLSANRAGGCFPVTACASFLAKPLEHSAIDEPETRLAAALCKAWITLSFEHPSLRSRVAHGIDSDRWKRASTPFCDIEQEQWLESTFKVVDTDMDVCQWFNEEGPLFEMPTVFYIRHKNGYNNERTIFLRCPHDMTDGIGILYLLDELFRHAGVAYIQGAEFNMPEWGTEHNRLSPCLRVAAAIPESLSDAQASRLKEVQTANGSIYNHPHLLGLPSSSSPESKDCAIHMNCLHVTVSKANTSQILRNCKTIAAGVSVTHVFMSAVAQTLANLQPRKKEPYPVRYVSHSMINLRPHCRPPYDSRAHAAAAYHTISAQALGLDLVVPSSSSAPNNKPDNSPDEFSRLTTQVRDFYQTIRPTISDDVHEQILFAPHTFHSMTPLSAAKAPATADPPFCPVSLSSIGNAASIVSPCHGPFELTRVWAASEPIGAGVAVFLSCWDGEIQLSGVFDTRYHAHDYVKRFLDGVVTCVYEGLSIGEQQAASKPVVPEEGRVDSTKRKREKEEVETREEHISSPRRVRVRARSPLREKPALGNVRMPSHDEEKGAEKKAGDEEDAAEGVNNQACKGV